MNHKKMQNHIKKFEQNIFQFPEQHATSEFISHLLSATSQTILFNHPVFYCDQLSALREPPKTYNHSR